MEKEELDNNSLTPKSSELMDTNASLWAELLFTFLPFLVIALVSIYKEGIKNIFYIPEWSLAAAILIGQALVKFITGLLPYGKNLNLGVVSFVISALIVLLLAPALIVMTMIMIFNEVGISLAIFQLALFLIAVIVFLFLGRMSYKVYIQTADDDVSNGGLQ